MRRQPRSASHKPQAHTRGAWRPQGAPAPAEGNAPLAAGTRLPPADAPICERSRAPARLVQLHASRENRLSRLSGHHGARAAPQPTRWKLPFFSSKLARVTLSAPARAPGNNTLWPYDGAAGLKIACPPTLGGEWTLTRGSACLQRERERTSFARGWRPLASGWRRARTRLARAPCVWRGEEGAAGWIWGETGGAAQLRTCKVYVPLLVFGQSLLVFQFQFQSGQLHF